MKLNGKYVFLTIVLSGTLVLPAHGESFAVTINTTPIQGQSGFFDFDFIGGSPVQNNTATISNFATDATLESLTSTGDAFGTISPGPGTLDDLQFFNELLQAETFGTNASFSLNLTTNVAIGGIPDSFSFFLLNTSRDPYATSDPTGADSLFTINIDQSSPTPQIFTSDFASVSFSGQSSVTPEPSTCSLIAIGLALSMAFPALLSKRAGRKP